PFDVVLAAHVLEHLRHPEALLKGVLDVLVPRGVLIAAVPNFGHWYARTRTALGLFDYDQKGILYSAHVRFFTRRSFLRRLRSAGFSVVRHEATRIPLETLSRGGGLLGRLLSAIDRFFVHLRPTLFGYQFVAQCAPPPQPVEAVGRAASTPRERASASRAS